VGGERKAGEIARGRIATTLKGRDAFFWAKKNVYYGIGSEEKNGPVIVSNSSICAQEKRYLLTDRKGAEKPVWIHMPT